ELLLTNIFPDLKTFELEAGWKLIFDETYSDLLIDHESLNGNVRSKLNQFITLLPGKDDRRQIILKATPFLMGVFDQEKTIRLYSPRLSQELFLIQEYQKLASSDLNDKAYVAFKNHVEKVAGLSAHNFPSEF